MSRNGARIDDLREFSDAPASPLYKSRTIVDFSSPEVKKMLDIDQLKRELSREEGKLPDSPIENQIRPKGISTA